MLKEACFKNYEIFAAPLRHEFEDHEIQQMHKVLMDLPTINMEFKIRGQFNSSQSWREDLKEDDKLILQPPARNEWVELQALDEYTLTVNLHRLGMKPPDKQYAPKFPKPKDEGWFLTLGSKETGELLALKRVAYRNTRSSHSLIFNAPQKAGRFIYTIYFISDGYIGLDQQFDLQFEVRSKKSHDEKTLKL